MANRWLIQKSKPRCVEYPRAHLWTDSWSNQSMPSTLYAVANVCKNGHFVFYALLDPLSVSHPPKMVPPYSLGTCPPTNPETLWSAVAPSSRKNWFSEGIFFWQITRMALELPKIDICQNWPRRVLGDVIRCLEFKFDKKIPMGSVPNCRKEIPTRHAIRWFKCKLKPPKQKKFLICKKTINHKSYQNVHFVSYKGLLQITK